MLQVRCPLLQMHAVLMVGRAGEKLRGIVSGACAQSDGGLY